MIEYPGWNRSLPIHVKLVVSHLLSHVFLLHLSRRASNPQADRRDGVGHLSYRVPSHASQMMMVDDHFRRDPKP